MRNSEKFTTAEERAHAYDRFCEARFDKVACCAKCELQKTHLNARTGSVCPIAWLDLEYKDEILPCPFCGGECTADGACTNEHHDDGTWFVSCNNENCYYSSGLTKGKDAAIAKHNRVARGAMETSNE